MSTKRLLLFGTIVVGVIAGVVFFAVQYRCDKTIVAQEKPVVFVSTFSLLEAAKTIAAGELEINNIIPLGSDAHMFSPSPTQVAKISSAALFIYNGAGFETWAQGLKNTLPDTVQVVDMSQYVMLQKSQDEHHDEHHEGEHDHGAYDPHYWLDIDNMIAMTQTLEAHFSKLLPEKKELFQKNAANYIQQLQKLKSEYQVGLAVCKNRTLVTNHDAFGYLAHANQLENISVIGLSSDEQPSAQMVAHIVDIVKDHRVKTIFFEELVNDNVAQAIAKETGVEAVPLQPLENISEDELKLHQTYLSIMRGNLAKLRESMECR